MGGRLNPKKWTMRRFNNWQHVTTIYKRNLKGKKSEKNNSTLGQAGSGEVHDCKTPSGGPSGDGDAAKDIKVRRSSL